jgi:hypothetical protein
VPSFLRHTLAEIVVGGGGLSPNRVALLIPRVPVVWREACAQEQELMSGRAVRLHASRGRQCVCAREQSASRDGVLGMRQLACEMVGPKE